MDIVRNSLLLPSRFLYKLSRESDYFGRSESQRKNLLCSYQVLLQQIIQRELEWFSTNFPGGQWSIKL